MWGSYFGNREFFVVIVGFFLYNFRVVFFFKKVLGDFFVLWGGEGCRRRRRVGTMYRVLISRFGFFILLGYEV